MADEPDRRRWLLEPPGAATVRVSIEAGPDVVLTSEQRAAVEAVVEAFYEDDVTGFALSAERCRPLACEPKVVYCAIHEYCGVLKCEVGIMPMQSMG